MRWGKQWRESSLRIPSDVRECDADPSPISKAGLARIGPNLSFTRSMGQPHPRDLRALSRISPPPIQRLSPSPPLNLRRIPAYSSLGLLRRRGALYHFQLRIEAYNLRLNRVLIPICDYSIGYGHSGPPLYIESQAPTQPSVNGQAKFDWCEGVCTVQVKIGQTGRTVST